MGRRLADRFNPALADARVIHFTEGSMAREVIARLRGSPRGWNKIMSDNVWFENRAVAALEQSNLLAQAPKPIVFAYSYASLGILKAARKAGCITVLGQIDPAVCEEQIVAKVVGDAGLPDEAINRAPPAYWDRWREECALADHIVVNSHWSREGLMRAGISPSKLHVVPLAYTPSADINQHRAIWGGPGSRPIHVLFLGSLIARKGIYELLAAARLLSGRPARFDVVGPGGHTLQAQMQAMDNVTYHGAVTRQEVHARFGAADVFVLPTHSDGFALTQLEAQSHGLPVIASRYCGDAVTDGLNGLLLAEVSPSALAAAVAKYLDNPAMLAAHSSHARDTLTRFTPDRVLDMLQDIVL
ncbi:MAG: glycosyltransferase family 4 protein [Pseudomonadota bacterium]